MKEIEPEHQKDPALIDKQEDIKEKINLLETPDLKLQELVRQMELAISEGETPHFKLFWELRKMCLDLFKENLTPSVRTQLWPRYRELSNEAKKLKNIFDEQSAFAVEQIEIAIKALEKEIEEMPMHLQKLSAVDFGVLPKTFAKKRDQYSSLQKRLNLLNAHASRINTLRKELIKTGMRIKHKNNFFERLSKAGDRIFPKRKELIKEVSDLFEKEIDDFVESHFGKSMERVPTYFLRDDIKHLQNIAKILTLNSQAFSVTRKKLSACWDALKLMDKERKKEIQTRRDQSKKAFEEQLATIEEIGLSFKEDRISPSQCVEKIDLIFKDLRGLDLSRDDAKELKERLVQLKQKAQDSMKEKLEERERIDREKRTKKQEIFLSLHSKIQEAMRSKNFTIQELKEWALKIEEEAAPFILEQGKEVQELGKKLKALNDFILEKEEEEMIHHSSEKGGDSLKALKEILQQKKKRRSQIKEEIRKSSGNSGLTFEKALSQNEAIYLERERLEKVDLAILEIERKIAELKVELRKKTGSV